MEDRLPRKLAAILYADVAGYSRLTGEDEDATHRTLRPLGQQPRHKRVGKPGYAGIVCPRPFRLLVAQFLY